MLCSYSRHGLPSSLESSGLVYLVGSNLRRSGVITELLRATVVHTGDVL